PFFSPGYVNNFIENNKPFGRYTHYPSLHALITGVVAVFFDNYRYPATLLPIFFGSIALLFWYLFIRFFEDRFISFISMLFFGLSVIYLDFIDSLANQS
ncbi:MAG: hypothetical protein HQK84_02435, partial [Nitrospinae bacterium]|nr:hypothetical protein [Nitrospinota bacterium]